MDFPGPAAAEWGLIFDVDGVIADTEPIAMEATRAVFKTYNGSDVAQADMLEYMGSTASTYFSALCEKYAPDADVDKMVAGHTRLLLREVHRARDLIFPGVRSLFMRACADPDCRLGLATGSGRVRSDATIAACNLPVECVEAWITGDDIAHAKPHPEIYLKVAQALELPPERCVAIEDSIAGVKSAKSAGMLCVAVMNTFQAEALVDADETLPSLEHVTHSFLRSLL